MGGSTHVDFMFLVGGLCFTVISLFCLEYIIAFFVIGLAFVVFRIEKTFESRYAIVFLFVVVLGGDDAVDVYEVVDGCQPLVLLVEWIVACFGEACGRRTAAVLGVGAILPCMWYLYVLLVCVICFSTLLLLVSYLAIGDDVYVTLFIRLWQV